MIASTPDLDTSVSSAPPRTHVPSRAPSGARVATLRSAGWTWAAIERVTSIPVRSAIGAMARWTGSVGSDPDLVGIPRGIWSL